ncbi:MAG: hypothetical protein DLM63_05250 [Solirubrobacterales bacterium]|nr:MAG: hypothetical protein DLM63_05250 [Solirubrobacterales bacterium]
MGAGHVLLHGFSQGAHVVVEITALDRGQAQLVLLTLLESGGTRDQAPLAVLAGSHWVLYCAGRDQYADITGCAPMRRAVAS